ncbi:MAG: hypothetical protein AAFR27_09620 [Pseudomonadota bacterium]
MSVTDNDLAYSSHIGRYQNYNFLSGDAETDEYLHHKAQHQHTLCVIDGIADILLEAVSTSGGMAIGTAQNYMAFGVARRSRMIWLALRQLYALIPPDRKEPLPHDDAFEASRALNDIYIHSMGMIDNYAWSIRDEFGDTELKSLQHLEISLFRSPYRRNKSAKAFAQIAGEFADWHSQIKELRNPVAHRIPLSVPPGVLVDEDQKIYQALEKKEIEARTELFQLKAQNAVQSDIDAKTVLCEHLQQQMEKLGKFVPMIVHDPRDGGTPIYPTVSDDVGKLVLLSRRLNSKISERLKAGFD